MARILVVDDQVDIRRLIRIALGRNHELAEAEDGKSGLAMARLFRPDLVVLDVMMPGGMDGLQVLDAIRDDPGLAAAKVILLTARGQARDFEEGMSRGADAYVVKPFSPAQLANSINALLAS
jgi:CheY-like chemotaxis protein